MGLFTRLLAVPISDGLIKSLLAASREPLGDCEDFGEILLALAGYREYFSLAKRESMAYICSLVAANIQIFNDGLLPLLRARLDELLMLPSPQSADIVMECIAYLNSLLENAVSLDDPVLSCRYLLSSFVSVGYSDLVRNNSLRALKSLLGSGDLDSGSLLDHVLGVIGLETLHVNQLRGLCMLFRLALSSRVSDHTLISVYERILSFDQRKRCRYLLLREYHTFTDTVLDISLIADSLLDLNVSLQCSQLVVACISIAAGNGLSDCDIVEMIMPAVECIDSCSNAETLRLQHYLYRPVFESRPKLASEVVQGEHSSVGKLMACLYVPSMGFQDFPELWNHPFPAVKAALYQYYCAHSKCDEAFGRLLPSLSLSEDEFLLDSLVKNSCTLLKASDSDTFARLIRIVVNEILRCSLLSKDSHQLALYLRIFVRLASDVDLKTMDSIKLPLFECMISRNSSIRANAFAIARTLNYSSMRPAKDSIDNLISSTSFDVADGHSNQLLLICDRSSASDILYFELTKQIRARHTLIETFGKELLYNNNLISSSIRENPVFPLAVGLVKLGCPPKCTEEFTEICTVALKDAAWFFGMLFSNCISDDFVDESDSSEHVLETDSWQRCFWRTIKHIGDLYLLVAQNAHDADTIITYVKTIARHMVCIPHWGAVTALEQCYGKAVRLLQQNNLNLVDDLQSHFLISLVQLDFEPIERVDGRHAGIANIFINIILESPKEHQHRRMQMLSAVLFDTASCDALEINLLGIMRYMLSHTSMLHIMSLPFKVEALKRSLAGFQSGSAKIRSSATSLFVLVVECLLGPATRPRPTVTELFLAYPAIQEPLYAALSDRLNLELKFAGLNSIVFPILVLFGQLSPCDNQSLAPKWAAAFWKLLSARNWHIRRLAARAFSVISSLHEVDEVVTKILQSLREGVELSQNSVHGYLSLLEQLVPRAKLRGTVVFNICGFYGRLHPINQKLLSGLSGETRVVSTALGALSFNL